VLIILAILATAALNMVEVQVDQTRFESSQRSIENVSDAIAAMSTDGRVSVASGFLPDMGRLPRAFSETTEEGVDILSLRELWDGVTTGLPAYSLVPAVATSILDHGSDDGDGDTISADSEVSLGTGWRGPYLQMPVGGDELRDGWGNHLRSFPGVTYSPLVDPDTYPHLIRVDDATGNEVHIINAGESVFGVRSLGRDDRDDGNFLPGSYDRDLPAIPASGSNLSLNPSMLEASVSGIVYVSTAEHGNDVDSDLVVVQIYYPNPNFDPTDSNSRQVAVQQARNDYGGTDPDPNPEISERGTAVETPAFRAFDFRFNDNTGDEIVFPVGPRLL